MVPGFVTFSTLVTTMQGGLRIMCRHAFWCLHGRGSGLAMMSQARAPTPRTPMTSLVPSDAQHRRPRGLPPLSTAPQVRLFSALFVPDIKFFLPSPTCRKHHSAFSTNLQHCNH